jgi:hypothetical protein
MRNGECGCGALRAGAPGEADLLKCGDRPTASDGVPCVCLTRANRKIRDKARLGRARRVRMRKRRASLITLLKV